MTLYKVLVYCLLTISAVTANENCEKDAENFGKCLKSEFDKNKDDYNKKLDNVWNRVAQCFKDNDCQPPTSNNTALAGLKLLKQAWNDMPKDAKLCFVAANAKKAFELVNACLKEQKVDEIKEPKSFEKDDLEEFSNETLPHNRVIVGLQRTVLALKKCRADKGAKAANATVGCTVTIKQDIKEEVCKTLDTCRKEKVGDTCHQKGQKIHQALCDCGKNKIKEFIKAVDDLAATDKEVPIEKLFTGICKTCKKDQEDIRESVKKCFKEKKVDVGPEPDNRIDGVSGFLTAAVNDPTGPAHAVLLAISSDKSKYNKKDLEEIRQILNDVLHNFDCGCTELS